MIGNLFKLKMVLLIDLENFIFQVRFDKQFVYKQRERVFFDISLRCFCKIDKKKIDLKVKRDYWNFCLLEESCLI